MNKILEKMQALWYGIGPTVSAPGVSEKMFDAMSKALFGSENVGAKWQSDVYPLPATMDKLLLPGRLITTRSRTPLSSTM